jgi:type IV pilus assembly protein PilA
VGGSCLRLKIQEKYMKRLSSLRNAKGFTLIELLVVIAIIGILSTLLFPAIQGALLKTKATTAGAKMGGKGLAGIVYSASLDRNALSQPEVYPSSTGSGPFAGVGSSTDYFKELFKLSAVTSVMQVAAITIPGQRSPPFDAASLSSDQNLWCVVNDVNTSSDPGTPFMFTKNINWGNLSGEPTPALNADNGQPILNDKLAIIVYAQGAVRVLDLNPDTITRDIICQGGSYDKTVLNP